MTPTIDRGNRTSRAAEENRLLPSEVAFGPVPSRRLGRSLGINNIPPKVCSYACVYCQLGRTIRMQVDRQPFFDPATLTTAVRNKVARVRDGGQRIDYLTFVPDGEPTLDLKLGDHIAGLQDLGTKIAVITNASLLGEQAVRDGLLGANWVSVKVDSTRNPSWHQINRPHGALDLGRVLEGVRAFASEFRGELATETMLVEDVNDSDLDLAAIADFLADLQPAISYLAIPTRPPAEPWVRPAHEHAIHRGFQMLQDRLSRVELLIGYEGDAFAASGDPRKDLLSITAVHPMRESAVEHLLAETDSDWDVVESLVRAGELLVLAAGGSRFYMRTLPGIERAKGTN